MLTEIHGCGEGTQYCLGLWGRGLFGLTLMEPGCYAAISDF